MCVHARSILDEMYRGLDIRVAHGRVHIPRTAAFASAIEYRNALSALARGERTQQHQRAGSDEQRVDFTVHDG